jgi:hypothetical protein
MSKRCGSYPYMNIAEDYGVDYCDVLQYSEFLKVHWDDPEYIKYEPASLRLLRKNPKSLDAICRQTFPDLEWK